MLISILFGASSQLNICLSPNTFVFFSVFLFRCPWPSLQTVCQELRSRKKMDGREKIESEIVGVMGKIGWQRWVDKRGMDK